MMIIAAFLEMVGIGLFIPLLGFWWVLHTISFPILSDIMGSLITDRNEAVLIVSGLLIVFFYQESFSWVL